MDSKYIFITGGVVSSLGKGLASSSIGMLLEKKGLKVAMMKLDPYLNVDPGTMSPFQHGEVYVTDDGAETDLDLGHYYRYTQSPLSKASNATSGQIYDTVIKNERRGQYLGKTVQVIPHITDEIKRRIQECALQEPSTDVVLVEIGGTVGDIEGQPFLEAIRQFRYERPDDCLNIHLTYVPYLRAAGEIKTKPTQHSVQALRQIGIFPDIILCRSEVELGSEVREKISLFCNVAKTGVMEVVDVKQSIYEVPLQLFEQGLPELIVKKLHLPNKNIDLADWKNLLHTTLHPQGRVKVGVVGKYVQHADAYKSVYEALEHGALAHKLAIDIERIDTDDEDLEAKLALCDGLLVPGGFGARGWNEKIQAARYARTHKLPYFGICLGLQVLLVELAQSCGLAANSTEMEPKCKEPVVCLLDEQQKVTGAGGTMRLGAFTTDLKLGSKAEAAYKATSITERHRHRYEFNQRYSDLLQEAGLIISGVDSKTQLCEVGELANHPFMLGVQFHPEFKSKPTAAHPLFVAFVAAMLERSRLKAAACA